MRRKMRIYLVPCRVITREYLLIKQGLENNPHILMVNNVADSDFLFLFYSTLEITHYDTKTFPPEKTIFIDFHDKPRWVAPVKCKAYFKRSWVKLSIKGYCIAKEPIRRPPNFHPIHFAIMDEFILDEELSRDILLTCTLRPHGRHLNRVRVLETLSNLQIKGKTYIGEFNKGSMRGFNDNRMQDYFRLLKQSRIIVTCNPNPWEGDHRTWEALASGALVFVDRMFTPMPHPLIDGKHCIFYDISLSGLDYLKQQIIFYLANPDKAVGIAKAGYEHAMKYHRTSNRIDNILDVVK